MLVKLNKCEFHIHSVDPQKKIIFIDFFVISNVVGLSCVLATMRFLSFH